MTKSPQNLEKRVLDVAMNYLSSNTNLSDFEKKDLAEKPRYGLLSAEDVESLKSESIASIIDVNAIQESISKYSTDKYMQPFISSRYYFKPRYLPQMFVIGGHNLFYHNTKGWYGQGDGYSEGTELDTFLSVDFNMDMSRVEDVAYDSSTLPESLSGFTAILVGHFIFVMGGTNSYVC